MLPDRRLKNAFAVLPTALFPLSLSSCSVVLALTERNPPRFHETSKSTDIRKKLGNPASTASFQEVIRLKEDPRFNGKRGQLSSRIQNKTVASRDDFVEWGTFSFGSGNISEQEAFAWYSANTFFLLEPFIAPAATLHWLAGRFKRNRISVWYSPSGHYVDHLWE